MLKQEKEAEEAENAAMAAHVEETEVTNKKTVEQYPANKDVEDDFVDFAQIDDIAEFLDE